MAEIDENDKDLLQKINTIIPSLNGLDPDKLVPMTFGPHNMAKNKYYGPKVMTKPRYLILLYVAGRVEHFKSDFGLQIDNNIYFSARSLEKIANYKGFKQRIEYDRTRAVKDHYLHFEGLVIHRRKEVPNKKDPSKTTFTDLVALTKKGQKYCETKVETLLTTIPEERRPKQKLTKDVVAASNAGKIQERLRVDLNKEYGLKWLYPDYFEFNKSTDNDLDNWRKGFSFDLPSIKAKQELRRERIIAKIKSNLESEGKLLIAGQSGSSKSTILMELMCDYFDSGYEVLYNIGVTEIRNADGLVNFIEDRLRCGEKILVATDNAHDEKNSSIFYVIDKLSNSQLAKNLKFIITARFPEFDWLLDSLDKVQEEVRKSIRKLIGNPKFIYDLPYFTREEIKEFMGLYLGIIDDEKSLEIYDYTKGDPIMVKFSVFGQGLEQDVEEMYDRYLRPQLEMKTMLICSLLDMSNIEITDKILELCEVIEGAYHLDGATLYRNAEGSWRTKHPRWDRELFSFLYSKSSTRTLAQRRKEDLKDSLIAIFGMREEGITYSVVGMLYYNARQNFVPIDIVESVFQQSIAQVPTFLSNETKSRLYSSHSEDYRVLKKYKEALDKSNVALKLNPHDAIAYNKKGLALTELRRFDEAVECFTKALEIDPNLASAWMHKGNALDNSRNYNEAMKCYDKAVEIDPHYLALLVWINQGACFYHLGKYVEAIECYDKALNTVHYEKPLHIRVLDLSEREDYLEEMNSIEAHTWSLRGDSLHELGKYQDAVQAYHESLKLNPDDINTWRNKAKSLFELGKYQDAIDAERRLLNLDGDDADAWLRKGMFHGLIDENNVAVECYDQVLKIDPNSAEAWYYKGLTLLSTGRSDAQKCLNKAKELGFKI